MKWEQRVLFDRVTFHGGGAHERSQWMRWDSLPPHHYWYWPILESPAYGYGSPEPSGRAWLYHLRRDWDSMHHRWRYWYDFDCEVKM